MPNSFRPDLDGNDLHDRLAQVFVDDFAQNTPYFGGGGPGYYGAQLENIALDGSELDLIVTFRAGAKYCCFESGCHFDFRDGRSWTELRAGMDGHGLRGSALPSIRVVRVVVETGALCSILAVYEIRPSSRARDTAMKLGRFRRLPSRTKQGKVVSGLFSRGFRIVRLGMTNPPRVIPLPNG